MHAKDLMTSPTITCHVNDSLATAAGKMWEGDIGVLPVVNDDGKLTGMLTDRDICMAAFTHGRALDEMLVNAAMSTKVVAASPDATLEDIDRLMTEHHLRRIPITDAVGKPIGVVSVTDREARRMHPPIA